MIITKLILHILNLKSNSTIYLYLFKPGDFCIFLQ